MAGLASSLTLALFLLTTALYLGVLYERDFSPIGVAQLLFHQPQVDSPNVYATIKVLPMVSLLAFVLARRYRSAYNLSILVGLVFSAAGDVLLVWGDKYFLFGMIAFGIAHMLYVLAFGFSPPKYKLGALCYLLGSLSFFNLTLGNLPDKYFYPVIVYHFLISSMIWRAFSRALAKGKNSSKNVLAGLGAASFMVSDCVLGINKFRTPFQAAHMVIMVTYFAAQLLISLSTDEPRAGNKQDSKAKRA